MDNALYLDDSYLKEFDATVVSVDKGKFVVLDRTAFYPNSGGQPWDEGTMNKEGECFKVIFVGKFSGNISHEVDREGLKLGDKVHCIINWERRHQLMRMHTSAHIVSTVIHDESGAKITGNQLGLDQTRIDFDLEDFDREQFNRYIDKANEVIKRDLPVRWHYLPREEAMKIPSIVKLANALPPAIDTLRIVEIGDFDKQADGGTHVKSTSEIGELELVKLENKGKTNRRIYYKLK